MRLLFVHDHYFDVNGDVIYSDKLPYATWSRYLEFFDNVTVFARHKYVNNSTVTKSISSGDKVDFVFADNISNPLAFFGSRSRQLAKLEQAIRKSNAVVARLPSEYGIAAVNIASKIGIPVLVEIVSCAWDSLWYNGSPLGKLYAPVLYLRMKKAISAADFAIYVSSTYLPQKYPTSGHFDCISDVELISFKEEIKHITRFPSGELPFVKIGLIGSFKTQYKGLDVAISSIAHLKKMGIRASLHILGEGDVEKYRNIAKDLSVQTDIFFEGTLKSGGPVLSWLDDKDIYIQPSLVEGMPRAVLEAMSRSLPVVASAVGGLPELVDQRCLVRPGDSRDLAHKIITLIENDELRENQSKKNFLKAQVYAKAILDAKRRSIFLSFSDFVRHKKS